MDDRTGLFRGTELPRLALLLALAVAGWGWFFLRGTPAEPAPPLKAASIPPLPPAETSGWFARVEDRTPLGASDYPAYAELLERARKTPAGTLKAQARREVMFGQLIEHPGRYRGIPIHLEGTARRVAINEGVGPGFSASGRLYEAWTFTMDSQRYPFCLVFEEPPRDLNVGADLYERVAFDGFFLKLMTYTAADSTEPGKERRIAPLLVGRLTKYADPTPTLLLPQAGKGGQNRWIAIALVAAAAIAVARVTLMFRRKRRPLWQPSSTIRPTDEVDPESLADWLKQEDRDEREDWQGDDEYEPSR